MVPNYSPGVSTSSSDVPYISMNRVLVLHNMIGASWWAVNGTIMSMQSTQKCSCSKSFPTISRTSSSGLGGWSDSALYVQARFTSFPLFIKHAARSAGRARAVCLHFEARTHPAQTERQNFRSAISEHWFSQVPRGKQAAELARGNYSHACHANVPADTVYMENRSAHGVLVFVTCLHGVA
jgi:hypothetical protein